MRLIHLPTGQRHNLPTLWETALQDYPDKYIRAELPQYWRVEGYDKSWEWATPKGVKCKEGEYMEYDMVAYNKFGYNNSACHKPNLPEISRAEFEYHIYNPWKEEQSPKPTSWYAEQEKEKENEMNWLRSSQAGWLVDPANGLLKNPTRPKIDYEKANLEYLQLLAESMGYDLVKKKESEKRWESEDNHFCFYNEELSCWIVDKIDGHAIVLDRKEITQLIKEVGHIIEKYEEFI